MRRDKKAYAFFLYLLLSCEETRRHQKVNKFTRKWISWHLDSRTSQPPEVRENKCLLFKPGHLWLFCYGSSSRPIPASFIVLPKEAKWISFEKTKQNPSIPKLSGLVWKAIQKSASFNSIQPRLLRLEKSSPVFYLFSTERKKAREKRKKNMSSWVPPFYGIIMRWYH